MFSALFSGLAGIAMQMAMKLVGYEFISSALITLLRSWSGTQESKRDAEIVEEMAKALGVPPENLQPKG